MQDEESWLIFPNFSKKKCDDQKVFSQNAWFMAPTKFLDILMNTIGEPKGSLKFFSPKKFNHVGLAPPATENLVSAPEYRSNLPINERRLSVMESPRPLLGCFRLLRSFLVFKEFLADLRLARDESNGERNEQQEQYHWVDDEVPHKLCSWNTEPLNNRSRTTG